MRDQLHTVVGDPGAVLLVGERGTGKRILAEILHHFGAGESESLREVEIDASVGPDPIDGFAYLCPLEEVSLEHQARLPELFGLGRLVLGTRLDPASAEGRARLHPDVIAWCAHTIVLPPLTRRLEDLEALAQQVIARTPTQRPVGGIAFDALECLRSHSWPDNVSEFEEVIRHALIAGAGPQIELDDLPEHLRTDDEDEDEVRSSFEASFSLARAEKAAVLRAMKFSRGNKRLASRLLGIGKTTLYRKLKRYRLPSEM